MTFANKTVAGTLLFVGGVIYVFGVGIGIHYSNTTVLNASEVLVGLLIIAGAIFIQKALKSMPFTILLILAGIGAFYILLPLNSNEYYALAYMGYIFFGLAAIMSYKFEKSPLSYISVLLGILALIMFALWVSGINLGSGVKIAPSVVDDLIVPWLLGFGAHIIGNSDNTSMKDKKS
jgi:hypothetical protein